MNPCRCGYLGDAGMECTKVPRCGAEYQNKLLARFDRIDIQVEVGAVAVSDLCDSGRKAKIIGHSGACFYRPSKARRTIQKFGARADGILTNAQVTTDILEQVTRMDDKTRDILTNTADRMKLSARAYHRLLKVSLTIADLGGRDNIAAHDVAEALSYRRLRVS